MCSICKPILGTTGGIPHTESQCALKQGCFCPVCGPSTHLPRLCPKKARAIFPRAEPIEGLPPIQHPPSLIMADTNEGYMEFLKQNELSVLKKSSENKSRIEEQLKSRETPLVLVTTPVQAKKVILFRKK